jgi:superfamily II DNA or RNA helicase
MAELRAYQREAVDAVLAEWERGVRSTLVVKATGLGKTVTASELLRERRHHGRILWLAHREELVQQAAESLSAHANLSVEIEKGDQFASTFAACSDVVVASVQSMHKKRRGRFGADHFATIVADEAHHAPARSWRDAIEYFSHACVVGLTATPDRGDQVGLKNVFESCAYEMDIRHGIDGGWLVPIRQKRVICSDLDLSDLKVKRGDLDQGELRRRLVQDGVLHQVAKPLVECAEGRPTLVFTAGVEQAHGLAEVVGRDYLTPDRVVAIDGETPAEQRAEYVEDFKSGRIQVLVNCGVFTEGFDARAASCIAVARPTRSRALYTQMIGRGTRTLPDTIEHCSSHEERQQAIAQSGKPDCLVLDFVDNSERHDLVTPTDVLAGKAVSEDEKREANKIASDEDVTVEEALDRAQKRAERRRQQEQERRERLEREAKVQAEVAYTTKDVEPFKMRAKEKGPRATDKQLQALKNYGVEIESTPSRREASRMIDHVKTRREKGLCTPKQARLLAKQGLRTDISKDAASKVIGTLIERKFKAPAWVHQQYGVQQDAAE